MRRVLSLSCVCLLPLGCIIIDTDPDDPTTFGFEEDTGVGDGDGDGDSSAGDGDGDPGTGDGDGEPTTSGDGDGDPTTTGDGDGDPTGDGDGDGDGDPGNPYGDSAQYCVDAINMYRASIGVAPVSRWVDAEPCSNAAAENDALTNTPHGAFGSCGEYAQNECPGWPGPPNQLLDGCLAQMWAEGPGEPFSEHGHYINMSNPNYTMVSCGFYQTAQGSYWALQNFK